VDTYPRISAAYSTIKLNFCNNITTGHNLTPP